MERPKVKNVLREPSRNNTYVVWAYRKLTEEELLRSASTAISRYKRVPKNRVLEIVTTIGLRD